MARAQDTALYETIQSQPELAAELLARDDAAKVAEDLQRARRIYLIGIGTSFHAAQVGAFLLRAAGVEATAVHSADFAGYPYPLSRQDAAILFSHRGTKQYTVLAAELAATQCGLSLAITGQGRTLPLVGRTIQTAPQEVSSTHTATYTAALSVVAQLAVHMGAASLREPLASLPAAMRSVIQQEAVVRELATTLSKTARLMLAGWGPNAVTAAEGALKLKEATYACAEGMGVEPLLHGPLVALGDGDTLLVVQTDGPGTARTAEVCAAASAIGLRVWAVGSAPAGVMPAVSLPALPELLSPIVAVLPFQLLAAFLAEAWGTNPDSFRRDQPAYDQALAPINL